MQPIKFRSEQSINGVKIKRLACGGGGKDSPQRLVPYNDGLVPCILQRSVIFVTYTCYENLQSSCRCGSIVRPLGHPLSMLLTSCSSEADRDSRADCAAGANHDAAGRTAENAIRHVVLGRIFMHADSHTTAAAPASAALA